MKVFLDTNVILEFFLDREDGKTATQLFAKLQEQNHSLFMTVGSFYTMIFLIGLMRGINDIQYKDIEDSCQYQAAQKVGCEVLLTFNNTDYPADGDAVPCVMTPQSFLNLTR